jgi:hypothetical protein
MPVQPCQENNNPGFQYGDQGKCYTYTPKDEVSKNKAKRSAILQGIAIGEYKNTSKK